MKKTSSEEIQDETTSIIGGKAVESNSNLSDKIFYLAIGVRKSGSSISWNSHCTATAISERVILTAAHCVQDKKASEVYLVSNLNPETKTLDWNQWIKAVDLKIHPDYAFTQSDVVNDVALVVLEKPVEQDRIVKLAQTENVRFPLSIVAIGYGTQSDLEKNVKREESTLNYVVKPVEFFKEGYDVFTIDQSDHRGFCSGDSGGPGLLYDPDLKEFFILGVVSNTSMTFKDDAELDPEGKFSLCIGKGNYMNLLNPGIRGWIEETQAEIGK